MNQPELEDFEVTPEQYAQYKGDRKKDESILSHLVGWTISISVFVWFELGLGWLSAAAEPLFIVYIVSCIPIFFVCFVWAMTSGGNSRDAGAAAALAFFWPLAVPFGIGYLIQWSAVLFKKRRTLKGSVVSRIKLYEEVEAAYRAELEEAQRQERIRLEAEERQRWEAERANQAALRAEQRKREHYWKSLGGIEFERELGKLFTARGYDVRHTGGSGDQGGDLILRKDGEITVVQCKAWKNPATPQVARELGGSMMYYKADNGILACTGGFSAGVFEFARGKPITLIDASAISRMAGESGDGMQDMDESPPVCPIHGCGSDMVFRNGRYGSFWGCSRYPACQGRRSLRATGSLFR